MLKHYRGLIVNGMLFSFSICILFSGCAYRWGDTQRTLPLGYKQVSIPVFKNLTSEPGVGMDFTDALIREVEKSRVGRITERNLSEIEITGVVSNIGLEGLNKNELAGLPKGAVLASEYRVSLTVDLTLVRRSDQTVLWSGQVSGTKTFPAAQITATGINSANPLYNLSSKRRTIQLLAREMMIEAHDRMTENF